MEQQAYITIAIDAALKAGNEILTIYNDPASDFEVEKKADNSPLTIADRKANAVICEMLKSTPYPILSEEGKHLPYGERRMWRELWVVDPLDGTKEFIKKNGEFTVNIALIKDGVPVVGVIYVPVSRILYLGIEGIGAYKWENVCLRDKPLEEWIAEDALRLPLAGDRGKDTYVVVASRSHLNPETETYIERLRGRYGEVELTSKGSSLKICLVAEGQADEYPRFAPTMEWDTAAGHAIVRAAGGDMWCPDGTPLVYNKENLLNPWFVVSRKFGPVA